MQIEASVLRPQTPRDKLVMAMNQPDWKSISNCANRSILSPRTTCFKALKLKI